MTLPPTTYLGAQERFLGIIFGVILSSPPSRQSPSPNHSTLFSQPSTTTDAKPPDTKDRLYSLYYAILCKGLEHLQILIFRGLLEPSPHRYWGMTVHISKIYPLRQACHACGTKLSYSHLSTWNLQQPHTWSSHCQSCFPPITFSYHKQNGLS